MSRGLTVNQPITAITHNSLYYYYYIIIIITLLFIHCCLTVYQPLITSIEAVLPQYTVRRIIG